MQCAEGQGFLYGKALSPEGFGAYLSCARIAAPAATFTPGATTGDGAPAAAAAR
jgi:hypothetical protein